MFLNSVRKYDFLKFSQIFEKMKDVFWRKEKNIGNKTKGFYFTLCIQRAKFIVCELLSAFFSVSLNLPSGHFFYPIAKMIKINEEVRVENRVRRTRKQWERLTL